MKKGIVIEINDEFLTLLTPEGQFLKAKKQKNCVLGEEILFTPYKKQSYSFRSLGLKHLSAAAAVLLILLGTLIPMYQNEKAYAYMSIDVKPSIELGINKKMQVVDLTPFNDDGKKVISNIGTWKKTDIAEVTQSIIKEMEKQGYLKTNESVVISTVRPKKSEEKTEKQLTKDIDEIEAIVKENNLKPILLNGTEEDMKKAHSLGITTGKYKEEKLQTTVKEENAKNTVTKQKTGKRNIEIKETNTMNAPVKKNTNKIKPKAAVKNNAEIEKSIKADNSAKLVPSKPAQKNETEIKHQEKQAWSNPGMSHKEEQQKVNKGQLKKQERFEEDMVQDE